MGSARTVVIHSGTYKTGSSAIQLYLSRAQNHGELAAAGISYPTLGRSTGITHTNLSSEIIGARDFNPANGGWDDVLRELLESDLHTVVVSTENFASMREEHIKAIGEKCAAAGAAVRWVHYVRDQPGFYNAFYVERLVGMRPKFQPLINLPFEEFRDWSPIDLSIMAYSDYLEQIRKHIPGVDLRLRPFSRKRLAGGDVVEDFCRTAEIPFVPTHAEQTNVGTGWRTTETARRLTPLVGKARLRERCEDAINPAAAQMRWTSLIRSELVKVTTEIGWNDQPAMYLTQDFRERLLSEYHADNVRVGEIGGFPFAEIVENQAAKPYNVGEYAEVAAEELMTVVSRVTPVIFQPPTQVRRLIEKGRRQKAAAAASRPRNPLRRLRGR